MQKKGYFFILDVSIAVTVLLLGILLIYSLKTSSPDPSQTISISNSLLDFMGSTKIRELNSGAKDTLIRSGKITNIDNSILNQVGEWYIEDDIGTAHDFVISVADSILPSQYGMELLFDGDSIVTISPTPLLDRSLSSTAISSKRLAYGVIHGNQLWGPMTAEVIVWQ